MAIAIPTLPLTAGPGVIVGTTTGGDTLIGDLGADSLPATADDVATNDTLDGNGGSDTLTGKAGDDSYIVRGATVVTENAGEGVDTVFTKKDGYILPDNVENLVLYGTKDRVGTGNSSDNILQGNDGKNTLTGGSGNDTYEGGKGKDIYVLDTDISSSATIVVSQGESLAVPGSFDVARGFELTSKTLSGLVMNDGDTLQLGVDTVLAAATTSPVNKGVTSGYSIIAGHSISETGFVTFYNSDGDIVNVGSAAVVANPAKGIEAVAAGPGAKEALAYLARVIPDNETVVFKALNAAQVASSFVFQGEPTVGNTAVKLAGVAAGGLAVDDVTGDLKVLTPNFSTYSIEAVKADVLEADAGGTALTFRVSRSADAINSEGSVDYKVVNKTTVSADFIGDMTGTVKFAAGELWKDITVWVKGDTLVEAKETFEVALTNPSGYDKILTASAIGVIENDDRVAVVAGVGSSVTAVYTPGAAGSATAQSQTFKDQGKYIGDLVLVTGDQPEGKAINYVKSGTASNDVVGIRVQPAFHNGDFYLDPATKSEFATSYYANNIIGNVNAYDGDDLISTIIGANIVTNVNLTNKGDAGNDTINIEIQQNTAWNNYAGTVSGFSNIAINNAGGDGNDAISVSLQGNCDTINCVDVVNDGGIGSDVISVDIQNSNGGINRLKVTNEGGDGTGRDNLSVSLKASYLTWSNSIVEEAGGGHDSISFDAQINGTFSSVSALLDGGDGNDAISADIQILDASDGVDFRDNGFKLLGGNGLDSLSLTFDIIGCDLESFLCNTAVLDAGGGNDVVSFAFNHTGYAITNSYDSNVVTLFGGAGNDALNFDWNGGILDTSFYNNSFRLDAGDGNDTAALSFWIEGFLSDTGIYNNSMIIDGGEGNNTLSMDIQVTNALSATTAYISSNSFKMTAGDGDDSLNFSFLLRGGDHGTSGTYTVEYNGFNISSGGGNDAINFAISATDASNYFYDNGIAVDGGDGIDTINARINWVNNFNVTDSYATFSFNSVKLTGGAGDDSIALDMTASYSGSNVITIDGGDGDDSLAFNLLVPSNGTDTGTAWSNTYSMIGGAGDDLINFAVTGLANQGSFYSNIVALDGGAGDDTIDASINWVNPFQTTGGGASVYSNDVSLAGAAGDDSVALNITASSFMDNNVALDGGVGDDALTLDLLFVDNKSTSDGAHVHNNDFKVNGGAGIDELTVAFNFALTGLSTFYTNNVSMNGGDGDDTLKFDFNNSGNTVSGWVGNNSVTMIGGKGDDLIDLNWNQGIQTDSSFSGNTFTIDGGAGDDVVNFALSVEGYSSTSNHTNDMGGNIVSVSGGVGDDLLTVALQLTDFAANFGGYREWDSASSTWNLTGTGNTIGMNGGMGFDTLVFSLEMNGGGSGDVSQNHFVLDAGDGGSTIEFTLIGRGDHDFFNNDIALHGGKGIDDIVANVLNGASSSNVVTFSGNTVYADGGIGNDTITLNFGATVDAITGDELVVPPVFVENAFYVEGGVGSDEIVLNAVGVTFLSNTFDVYGGDANVPGTDGVDTISINAQGVTFSHNLFYVDGGKGNDTVSLLTNGVAFNDNHFNVFGDGSNVIGSSTVATNGNDLVTFTAISETTFTDNTFDIYGGIGDDEVNVTLGADTAIATTLHTSVVFANNITNVSGGDGDDTITLVANGETFWSNDFTIDGGDGVDTINVEFSACDNYGQNDVRITGGEGYCDPVDPTIIHGDIIDFTNNTLQFDQTGSTVTFIYNSLTQGSDTIVLGTTILHGSVDPADPLAVVTPNLRFEFDSTVFDGDNGFGVLDANSFVSGAGAVALDADDYFIYDTTAGTLSYDADGNGTGAAINIATFTTDGVIPVTDLFLAADDIWFV